VLSPPFRAVTARPELKSIARSLSFLDPVVVQSMAILKPPRIGGEVVPHQDSTFLYTDPPSAVGVWIPTEKCTEENGCLWFWAGSHKTHPIASRFIRDPERVGTKFISTGEVAGPEPTDKDWIPLPCNAGDLVLIHGSAVHKSEHNHSDKTRYAYTFHLLEGNNKYPADNWLQNSGREPFTRLFEM
jgi:ectoine hydroxylase-related dioxygenase (phytanoyl-CoA dioxygenase family)